MREFEGHFPAEGFNKGLRQYSNTPQNSSSLVESFNIGPGLGGSPELHQAVLSLNTDIVHEWGGLGLEALPLLTRTITISIKDYVSDEDVAGAEVFIDGLSAGMADLNGEINISSIEIGGHSIRVIKAGYLDTNSDNLINSYFVVT